MRKAYQQSQWTDQQRKRRDFSPIIENGCVMNGCIPLDDFAESIYRELESEAVEFGTLWEAGDMPVLKYGENFKSWRAKQIEENKKLREERITCTLPWQVLKHLTSDRKKSDRLYFTQGGLGSCSGHGDAFAHQSSVLQLIARGASLTYCSINPVVMWAITKGGSTRGGQTISEIAKGANTIGHFPEFLVGTNNQSVPAYQQYLADAKKWQSAIMFLNFRGKELANEIIECCAAGLSVPFANSTAVNGCKLDKNGVKVANISGFWAHMTHFTAYRVVNSTEYVGWVNSHGPIYKSSDEGEPADMCWMSRAALETFVQTADGYGAPYVIFPESIATLDTALYVKQPIPFPTNWRFS